MCRGVFEGRYPALVKAAVESWETLGWVCPAGTASAVETKGN